MVERFPCVVRTQEGDVVDLALIDEKGCSKSLESGVLWTVHGETGRLLPYAGSAGLVRLERKDGWCLAVVDLPGEGGPAAAGTVGAPSGSEAFRGDASPGAAILSRLARLVGERRRELPEGSYTTHLFTSGIEKIKKKTGEEAVELILAEGRGEIVHESADLLYHLLVLLEASGVEFDEVLSELEGRFGG